MKIAHHAEMIRGQVAALKDQLKKGHGDEADAAALLLLMVEMDDLCGDIELMTEAA